MYHLISILTRVRTNNGTRQQSIYHHFLNETLFFRGKLFPLSRRFNILLCSHFCFEDIKAHRTFNAKITNQRFSFIGSISNFLAGRNILVESQGFSYFIEMCIDSGDCQLKFRRKMGCNADISSSLTHEHLHKSMSVMKKCKICMCPQIQKYNHHEQGLQRCPIPCDMLQWHLWLTFGCLPQNDSTGGQPGVVL